MTAAGHDPRNRPIQFTWSDAWLLLAMFRAGGLKGATLKGTIAWGDAVNHAIFTPAELRNGVARLIAAGFIAERAGAWVIIGEAAKFFANPIDDRNPTAVQRFLGAPSYMTPYDPRVEDPKWTYPALTDEAIHSAAAEYSKEMRDRGFI